MPWRPPAFCRMSGRLPRGIMLAMRLGSTRARSSSTPNPSGPTRFDGFRSALPSADVPCGLITASGPPVRPPTARLAEGWRVDPVAAGHARGANFRFGLSDQLAADAQLAIAADGKPDP